MTHPHVQRQCACPNAEACRIHIDPGKCGWQYLSHCRKAVALTFLSAGTWKAAGRKDEASVMTSEAWSRAKNILSVRLDYLGDVLMCTPAIRAIKDSLPGRRVTLLTSGSGAAAVPFIPEIDDAIAYAAPWMKSSEPHASPADLAMVEELRQRNFDAAVIFTTYSQSTLPAALLTYLAGIPLRLAHCRENPYRMLTHWVPETEPEKHIRHEVQRQLDLVATVGCSTANEKLSFQVLEDDLRAARRKLHALGIAPDRPWIMLHPGATAASRRYPLHHWRQAAIGLATNSPYPLVFTGSLDEAELIEAIRDLPPQARAQTRTLAGELSLGELGAMIALAALVISNNTGPAHMAAAIGTPLVDLYALTNPQHTPWQVDHIVLSHDVPCRNCYKSVCPMGHHDCLEKVAPGAVVDAARSLLAQPRRPA
jgi:lipopolysaccharide heptosyltransferase II